MMFKVLTEMIEKRDDDDYSIDASSMLMIMMMIKVRDALQHCLYYQFQAVATEQAEFSARWKKEIF